MFKRKVKKPLLAACLIIFFLMLSSTPAWGQDGAPTADPSGSKASQAQPTTTDEAIQNLIIDSNGTAQVSMNAATDVAKFVSVGDMAASPQPFGFSVFRASETTQADTFLGSYGAAFGITDPDSELRLEDTRVDDLGMTHLTYQQVYDGVEVFASIVLVHMDTTNNVQSMNGVFVPNLKVNVTPNMTAEAAGDIALSIVTKQNGVENASSDITAVNSHLYIFRQGLVKGVPGSNHLAYEIEVANSAGSVREFVYVDAHTGKILDQITGIYEAMNRVISVDTIGNVVWSEGDALPYVGSNAAETTEVNGIIEFSVDIYDFFYNTFGYDAWDGAGGDLATVWGNIAGCPNAFAGGGVASFCPGVASDETVGHEWGHNYTGSTHNLIYQWQSGALNESYSDIWGETIDLINGYDDLSTPLDTVPGSRPAGSCSRHGNGDPITGEDNYRWVLGEDDYGFAPFFSPAYSGAIRDSWNPNCFGDPGKVTDTAQYVCTTADGGGVHTNSGIPNHAHALLVDGGTYNGHTIDSIGLVKAAAIYWRAQTIYQTPSSNFVDHADALENSCSDLIGAPINDFDGSVFGDTIDAADCTAVSEAIAAVEFRTEPDFCGFTPMFETPAPELCVDFGGAGSINTIHSQDWESGLGGWTVGTRDVVDPLTFDTADWAVVGSLPDSRPGSALFVVDDPSLGNCADDTEAGVLYAESPAIVIPAGADVPRIALDHWVATEDTYDGGNLKVSVNSGAWQLVPASAFEFNAYPGGLAVGGDNPMNGEPAFTGTDGGEVGGSWGQSQVNLAGIAAPGDTIQIRMEMGLDGCNGVVGWYVDEVQTYSCTGEVPGALCGDSILNTGETCDDGNSLAGDGCSNVCQIETGYSCTLPIPPSASGNAVADGSFEAGSPNANWTESSTNGPNVIGAWGLPSDGTNHVWLGGWAAYEEGIVSQSLTIPSTATSLDFDLLVGVCDDAADYMEVTIDGNQVYNRICNAVDAGYVTESVALGGYADDGVHTMTFHSESFATNTTHSNFFLDNVVISDNVATNPIPSECTVQVQEELLCNGDGVGFEYGLPDDWTVVTNAGIDWSTTADGQCSSGLLPPGNFAGTGEAACVDSDAFGSLVDSYLCSPPLNLSTVSSANLDFLVNYQIYGAPFEDVFEVVVSTTDPAGPYDPALFSVNSNYPDGAIAVPNSGSLESLDLSAYAGQEEVYVCYHYVGDYDWYAHVDDVALSCEYNAELSCDAPAVSFDGGIEGDWVVIDNETNGLIWTSQDDAGLDGNYTGGTGIAPSVNSDGNAGVEYDTELRSPLFDLPTDHAVSVEYLANYRDVAFGFDLFDLDISTDGGSSWTTLLQWDDDFGGFFGTPGEAVSVDLAAYAGMNDLMLRWRYYDPEAGDWDWYAQVDDIDVSCVPVPNIDVDPDHLDATQFPDEVTTQTVDISNTGTADLDWSVDESNAPAGSKVETGASYIGAAAGTKSVAPAYSRTEKEQAEILQSALDDVVQDGGLEAGSPSPFWAENTVNGFEIVGPWSLANSGAGHAWFGGFSVYEEGTMQQDVTIPAGAAELSFYLLIGICDSPADYLEVLIDGNSVYSVDGSSAACGDPTYALQTVDVSAYADGGLHTLAFHSETFANNAGNSNFFVDDIALNVASGCDAPSDIPWASVAPSSGTTAPSGTSQIDVTFDSNGLNLGTYEGTLCVNSNDPDSPRVEVPLSLTVELPPRNVVYISTSSGGHINGMWYGDEDILAYDVDSDAWSKYFDGYDVDLAKTDIDAFHIMKDGSILMSFDKRIYLHDLGMKVDDSDIVHFIPTSLGEDTAGSFELYFDGSDVGLTKGGEDVDAIGMTRDGRLIVSTSGNFNVPGASGKDEDMIIFDATSLGGNTSGSWALYFDGSDVDLKKSHEDIWGVWVDPYNTDIYLTTWEKFSVPGLEGSAEDIFICDADSVGSDTSCSYRAFWDGSMHDIKWKWLDGISIGSNVGN